jgi:tRNA splicing ligase
LIKGVGDYEDVEKVVDSWNNNTDPSFYQIFGHRNVNEYKIDELKDKKCYILEGKVEFGGNLRAVRLSESAGCICVDPIYIKNNIYKEEFNKITSSEIEELNVSDFVNIARKSRLIVEKKFEDNISSFNFTREAFEKGIWDNFTVTARGLYIDTEKNSVLIRGYSKFWNVNEREETSLSSLRKNLTFPVKAYLKENGFLGLLSVKDNNFILATKSRLDGIHKEWFEDIFYKTITSKGGLNLFNFLKENNATALFEVVDIKNDPHIISYKNNKIVLLDIVKNSLKFEKVLSYKDLKKKSSEEFDLECKELVCEFDNFEELLDFYNESQKESWKFNGNYIEGVVFEDSNGYMTKLKTGFYQEWKHLRSISEEVFNKGYSDKTGSLLTPVKNEFYCWLTSKVVDTNKEQRKIMKKNIIELRDEFYNSIN